MQKPMDDSYKLYIGGKWVDVRVERPFKAYCPATENFTLAVLMRRNDVDAAVKAAQRL